jgi:hypothetical protein
VRERWEMINLVHLFALLFVRTSICPDCAFPGTYDFKIPSVITTGWMCADCPSGTYSPTIGTTDACSKCVVGTYSDNGQSSCTLCSAGSFTNNEGSTSCVSCGAGKFSPQGSASCMVCSFGTWSTPGSEACTPCPPGRYSDHLAAPDESACRPCPAGTISGIGAQFCTSCGTGTFSVVNGSSSCSSCMPGSFSSIPASTACHTCPAGTYNPGFQASSCLLCPAGTTSDPGSSSSNDCVEILGVDGSRVTCSAPFVRLGSNLSCQLSPTHRGHTGVFASASLFELKMSPAWVGGLWLSPLLPSYASQFHFTLCTPSVSGTNMNFDAIANLTGFYTVVNNLGEDVEIAILGLFICWLVAWFIAGG